MRRDQPRRGTILIVVVGLLAILAALSATFLVRIKADAAESGLLVAHAQTRHMLAAALMYLQESSRLGWTPDVADPAASGWDAASVELATQFTTCGWTDVRDGSLGPRLSRLRPMPGSNPLPPHTIAAGWSPAWWRPARPDWPAFDRSDPPVPPPWWWTYATPYPTAPGAWTATTSDSLLPPAGLRRWPCPGSVLRVDAYAVRRPPAATRPYLTANPFTPAPGANAWYTPVAGRDGAYYHGNVGNRWWPEVGRPAVDSVWLNTSPDAGFGALDPQPVSDTVTDYHLGDQNPEEVSLGRAWFRVYRELKADHNNADETGDGIHDPWYDQVPAPGYDFFIIAAGSGGSRGFRFYSNADPGWSADLEPVTADAVFPSRATFEAARIGEVVIWFRVAWSGWTSSVFDASVNYGGNPAAGFPESGLGLTSLAASHSAIPAWINNPNPVGNFAWLQRLDREPPRW